MIDRRQALYPRLRAGRSGLRKLVTRRADILAYLSALDRSLALALTQLEKARAHRPELHVFDIVADFARQFHAAGDLEMVEAAVVTARRMLADLQCAATTRRG
jgi:hypothetical protein